MSGGFGFWPLVPPGPIALRGEFCTPILPEVCQRLDLAPLVDSNTAPLGTSFLTPVDHYTVKTGITAEERSRTVQSMIDPRSTAEQFLRPGHVHPLLAKEGGVLRRAGLVASIRGKAGGYALARTADQIRVGEALAALGGRLFDSTFCERHSGLGKPCLNNSDCSIRPVLRHVQLAVDQVLAELTLKSLLCSEREMTVAMEPRGIPLRMAARPS